VLPLPKKVAEAVEIEEIEVPAAVAVAVAEEVSEEPEANEETADVEA
jgi:hypothetical protein